jgi:hypothetical protein
VCCEKIFAGREGHSQAAGSRHGCDARVAALLSSEKTISIAGELKYQACDNRVCYPPTSVPVMWSFQVTPLDLKRSPQAIRHK